MQRSLFDKGVGQGEERSSTTFADNLSLPVHRWFRYSAGFSALWVRQILEQHEPSRVLDPFAGSGTVLIEAEACGAAAIGLEAHPFVSRIASAKLLWHHPTNAFCQAARELVDMAREATVELECFPELMRKCYPDEILLRLASLRQALKRFENENYHPLLWLALASILRGCSPVGTANWQYVLPNKSKSRVAEPYSAFAVKTSMMASDMAQRQSSLVDSRAVVAADDARVMDTVEDDSVSMVITSPPYPNNFDYADATRLEMTFFGEVGGWGELQQTVRKHLLRSCTQHMASEYVCTVNHPNLNPIQDELEKVYSELMKVRETRGGKKKYHEMIVAYFVDMAEVWKRLRKKCTTGSTLCFVIGDSAPYGVHVPVERWLGELALANGFLDWKFEKTRDRNTKWKNRKHRVPLHEGRLWVKG